MVYSGQMRTAVGAMRACLTGIGLGVQDRRFTRHGEHDPAPNAPLVLVACSGGRDSTALAAVARTVCSSLGVRCGAVIVDHGLQRGSTRIAERTARRCAQLGLDPVCMRTVEVRERGSGMESAARDARYQALAGTAREHGASAVLLGHTCDDQAETVILGLLRSGGVDAIAGMPSTFDYEGTLFARPFLDLRRADTTAICEQLRLPWWDDPTNGDDAGEPLDERYPLRSRVRHELMPMLARLAGGDVAALLARGARSAQYDKAYLDAEAERALSVVARFRGDAAGEATVASFDAVGLGALHPAIRRRVIAHGLAAAGIAVNQRQIEAIERLATEWHGQGAVHLSGGYSANRQKHVIRVCQDGMHENRGRSRADRS